MIQVATLLGSVMSGLRDRHYPKGNAVYVVRDEAHLLYIGETRKGVWQRIRSHIIRADDAFGTVTRAHWPAAAKWHAEVCYFGDAGGIRLLEQALIGRYCPECNRTYNRGIPDPTPMVIAPQDLATMGESCQHVLAEGWPSFQAIALEPPAWQRTVPPPRRRGRTP